MNVAPLEFRGRRTRLKGQTIKQEPNPVIILPKVAWSKDTIIKCQLKDDSIAPMIQYLEEGILPHDKKKARKVIISSDFYFLEDSVLYLLLDTKSQDPKRQIEEIRACLVVPKELKFDILTYSTLRLKYYWKGMYRDCKNFVAKSAVLEKIQQILSRHLCNLCHLQE